MARITPAGASPPPQPREDFGPKVAAHQRYYAGGKQVPSVTSICKLVDNNEGVVRWANNLGLQGISSDAYRDEAAATGNLAHELIRRDIDGLQPRLGDYTADQMERAEYSLARFREWRADHQLTPTLVEASLTSELYRFGGRIDCYCDLDGRPTLVDFKSGDLYFSHRVQVAGYWWLLYENGHRPASVRILGVGRGENEELTEKVLTGKQVIAGWQVFKRAREIYDLKKQVAA